ncbi:MAG TPA: hypothetical protein VFD92_06730 [Candidatus Binatia bacterium]|nr:hypothetical protein [Candidatus Binatia bacterium]
MKDRLPRPIAAALAAACVLAALALASRAIAQDAEESGVAATAPDQTDDLDVATAHVTLLADLDLLVFEQEVKGTAGGTVPKRRGAVNGAAVLAYLFPTTLAPDEVGFGGKDGIVTLAVTSHPDFDDTPLWDETGNRKLDDDGAAWHAHWLLLVPDRRAAGGFRVRENDAAGAVPSTAPAMPIAIDSPGFAVVMHGSTLRVLVPADRVQKDTNFTFDAMTAYLQMSSAPGTPALGVYRVYDSLSGAGKMPLKVFKK